MTHSDTHSIRCCSKKLKSMPPALDRATRKKVPKFETMTKFMTNKLEEINYISLTGCVRSTSNHMGRRFMAFQRHHHALHNASPQRIHLVWFQAKKLLSFKRIAKRNIGNVFFMLDAILVALVIILFASINSTGKLMVSHRKSRPKMLPVAAGGMGQV